MPNALNCTNARTQGRTNLENNQSSGNYMIDPDDGGPIEPFSVYCLHVSPSETLTEVFDLSREPNLTNEEVLEKMNKFSTSPLSLSNISRDNLRDGVQGVAWHSSSNNLGLSYGLDKMSVSGLKFSARRTLTEPIREQGALTLHNQSRTRCSNDWYTPTGCMTYAYKNSANQHVFSLFDGTFGSGAPWNMLLNGTLTAWDYSQTINDQVVDNIPSQIYLTSYGRFDVEGENPPTRFYFTKLYLKDLSYAVPVSCSQAKTQGSLNIDNNTNSGVYVLDHDGYLSGDEPTEVYCDMSGVGVATITRPCKEAKIYGQKSLNNDLLSGLYQIDIDGLTNGDAATGIYCDMGLTAWDNNNGGGYTLVGVFNINQGTTTTADSSVSMSDVNKYLTNSKYVELLSRSSEIVFRSNRQNNTEVVMKTLISSLGSANCSSNLTSIAPVLPYGNLADLWVWNWAEPDCNASNADYTLLGMRNDGTIGYFTYGLSTPLAYVWSWNSNSFVLSTGFGYHWNRAADEKLYIFVK